MIPVRAAAEKNIKNAMGGHESEMYEAQIKEMKELVAKLNAASEAYYSGNAEQMTDYEWDAGFDRLKKLEEETGVILPGSPVHNVSTSSETGQ
jgi:NAD-dependent DNA ligase